MIEWIKRAVRWPWFGRREPISEVVYRKIVSLRERPEFEAAVREATIAQKNLRLASIARTRAVLIEKIADAVKYNKKRSHLRAELKRLTTLELELETPKAERLRVEGEG